LAILRKNFVIRKYIYDKERARELYQAITELFQGDLAITQKASNDLRIAVGSLSTYGRQLLLARDRNSITSIQANKIAQAARLFESSLKTLKKGVANSAELDAIVQKIELDFFSLEAILTEADDSIAALQSQWLGEQENMRPLSASLQESVDSITTSLNSLQVLSENVRTLAENEALQARETAERIIGIVSIIAIVFMVITGTLIARRIIGPINKAVSFARKVSKGDFTSDIDVKQKD
jgi:methyl-accepting chemotaxis protein